MNEKDEDVKKVIGAFVEAVGHNPETFIKAMKADGDIEVLRDIFERKHSDWEELDTFKTENWEYSLMRRHRGD